MKILDPQAAVLTNVEVLAYLTANPPAVRPFHNYVSRISPHLLKYPRSTDRPSSSHSQSQTAMTRTMRPSVTSTTELEPPTISRQPLSNEPTPLDRAIRSLIQKLRPYGLTKAEVLTIVNLGIGLSAGESEDLTAVGEANGHGEMMEVDETPVEGEGEEMAGGDGAEGEEGEEGGATEADYGALALFDAVIEEREERISDDDLIAILGIIRETLNENYTG
ncbi:hypothetical protein POX_b02824 [Penicillium oxalicum]|uniref:hypothetical protein n=1 Tax=Penicillium oxalicum TaxID=69781 RepID=UPI0020B871CA|nr:hypothetical protein POX_b02824 [Penicillium oxalicum]KAI2792781.1 hypothetical protein POX_b02824 [Penicillium oxalicum]